MEPITALRNCLGKEHGGSGISLDKLAYKKCIQFWQSHAIIKKKVDKTEAILNELDKVKNTDFRETFDKEELGPTAYFDIKTMLK